MSSQPSDRPNDDRDSRRPAPLPPASDPGAAAQPEAPSASGAPAPLPQRRPFSKPGAEEPAAGGGLPTHSAPGDSAPGSASKGPTGSGSGPAAAAGGPKTTGPPERVLPRANPANSASPRHMIESWLAVMVKSGASDLILRAGGRPSQRVNGKISFLPGRVPGPGALLEVLEGVMGTQRMDSWRQTGSADSAINLDGLGRFRMNAYKQMGEPAVVIRRIGERAPELEELNLPSEQLKQLSMRRRGLVLVTGVAGSGKSSTLAGMIQYMNQNVERHVITLEDPVELLFKEKCCVISQREVGTDTTSFKDGLRHALRQSPDVMLIGEVRDAETVVAALEATETGHMVLSTMHTVNAAQTVDRILGFFPAERHNQIRQRLADNLAGVISQRLVPRMGDEGLVPAYELMVPSPHIRELIEEGKTAEMARVIDSAGEVGLISYNQSLQVLVESQQVELGDALAASDRPDELLLALRGIRGGSSRQGTSGPSPTTGGGGGLSMGGAARGAIE